MADKTTIILFITLAIAIGYGIYTTKNKKNGE